MSTLSAPAATLETAAKAAGLVLTPLEPGKDFHGEPTVRASLTLAAAPGKSVTLELSQGFDAANPKFAAGIAEFFAEAAVRLLNPNPDATVTFHGLPLTFANFAWPFHGSSSGADTFIVHGDVKLADGLDSPLHAKVSGSLTRTFAEVLPALEQPFAESFIYNAVRKVLDQGQLEMVKSGNRQPVPVTTRYYSAKQKKFIFNDASPELRSRFLDIKTYWLSYVLTGGTPTPIWIADPRDAQYLNTTTADLRKLAQGLQAEGKLKLSPDGDWATATQATIDRGEYFRGLMEEALSFTRPSFNEDMRAGNTNM
ncbi:hypothetical protein SAMN05421819_2223 [Bryocella elongata]|uniref:Uncharacterized protein n=1 Tax=Bryocella elongata TaxID=863522 RepID=A0A1H5YD08_9BACT|nr:hypothetical protein [Bryocella elongata]SEG21306.1 hypothetical protein SAMN05421819_2223 [Bryocella elongata]